MEESIMRQDPTEFRERFKRWKAGEKVYDAGTPTMPELQKYNEWVSNLPKNLQNSPNYDLYGAWKSGATPTLEEDGFYHLPTRDPNTGLILKRDFHPTLLEGLAFDIDAGYYPKRENGRYYTRSWQDFKTVPEYDGGKTPNNRPKTHWLTRFPESIVDASLYGADVLGVPSHITNALRDINIWRANQPVIVADALYNMLSGKKDNVLDAYREADTNPSELAKHFEVFPIENTESNYTGDELAAQYELRQHSGGKPGAITSDGYKWANSGRYAGDIDASNFMSPFKVNEWSLGQTSGIKGEDGNNYTSDIFAYDTKDTFGNYLPRILKGTASPVMFLRTLLGTFGSKGYSDNSNSATAIRTKINTKVQQKAYQKKYGTTERKRVPHDYNFGKSPKIIHCI